jgi:hypothetical protein
LAVLEEQEMVSEPVMWLVLPKENTIDLIFVIRNEVEIYFRLSHSKYHVNTTETAKQQRNNQRYKTTTQQQQ